MCLGVPGKVIEIYESDGIRMGKVDFGGLTKEACLAYVPEVELGDYTIIHVGFAITKLDEQSALETLELFNQIGFIEEEFGAADAEEFGMKYLEEFRDLTWPNGCWTTSPHHRQAWAIMEVCGDQAHSIIRNGIDQLLPAEVELIHGPGCVACASWDHRQALAIAAGQVIACSFGDMLRVPSGKDLFRIKSEGGDVRIVYSPHRLAQFARKNPDRQVVFFGVGFETTAPANAMAVHQARLRGIPNFSMLVSHVRVPPALNALLDAPDVDVQGFLLAGHVCAVMGYWEYHPLAERYHVPMVVTGFEPLDVLEGIRRAVHQLEAGDARLENAYERAVTFEGNVPAQRILEEVFEVTDRTWRGIGMIPQSGWKLRPDYEQFDAENRFDVSGIHTQESPLCRSGEVLQGLLKPNQCPAFGKQCTPQTPLGATMVSSEGACAAYYRYGRAAINLTESARA